jgi:hypothetical protein
LLGGIRSRSRSACGASWRRGCGSRPRSSGGLCRWVAVVLVEDGLVPLVCVTLELVHALCRGLSDSFCPLEGLGDGSRWSSLVAWWFQWLRDRARWRGVASSSLWRLVAEGVDRNVSTTDQSLVLSGIYTVPTYQSHLTACCSQVMEWKCCMNPRAPACCQRDRAC